MSLGIGLSLLLAGALRAARWWPRRTDSLGRRFSFPFVTVGLCAVLAGTLFVTDALHRRTEHRLAAAATALAGTPVSVHCQTFAQAWMDVGPELGYVPFGPDGIPEHHTVLKWDTCRRLAAYLRSDRNRPGLDEVIAVHVLTHESMHMAGSRNEATTECRAVQRDSRAAGLLGADRQQSRRLATRYWLVVYPRTGEDYRTPTCAPDAALDEHLPDAPWS